MVRTSALIGLGRLKFFAPFLFYVGMVPIKTFFCSIFTDIGAKLEKESKCTLNRTKTSVSLGKGLPLHRNWTNRTQTKTDPRPTTALVRTHSRCPLTRAANSPCTRNSANIYVLLLLLSLTPPSPLARHYFIIILCQLYITDVPTIDYYPPPLSFFFL